jgi:hypothetical protein
VNESFDVKAALLLLYRRLGTWRRVAHAIGAYSAAYWSCVARGALTPSRRAENRLRRLFHVWPVGIHTVHDLSPQDLAWFLRHRHPL